MRKTPADLIKIQSHSSTLVVSESVKIICKSKIQWLKIKINPPLMIERITKRINLCILFL